MQERVVREIRTLRAMWRALETGSRQVLNGHEGGNPGHKPRMSLRATAPVLDPTGRAAAGGVLCPRASAGRVVPVGLYALSRTGGNHRWPGVSAFDLSLRLELFQLGNRKHLLLGDV